MPTYQYACTECGHGFEIVQKFSDASLTECPECHGKLRKVYNAVGVVFKGSGFYKTDSRSGSGSGPSSSSSSSATSTGSSSGSSDSGSSSTSSSTSSTSSTSSSSSSGSSTSSSASS
ncbi:FmdB family zinc ribbon protein [Nocardioides sp. GY 10127]|uniref:FmdB family zinc ribbon protein n=1 Tax=Nocardioides sp. GY 10127 TaxID=2569762 RepID=UPI0010A894D0|nr:FmdB family zinc ribbon protein [Nocardioides sp. GY 10127]TIC79096.1 FmdB family transcriptional regulator [Nocardioides sp. GY 10127]